MHELTIPIAATPDRVVADCIWLLATPYETFPGDPVEAFKAACRCKAWLIESDGPVCYSPVAESFGVAMYGGVPMDSLKAIQATDAIAAMTGGLLVALMPGWSESEAILAWITAFSEQGKPVQFIQAPPWVVTGEGV